MQTITFIGCILFKYIKDIILKMCDFLTKNEIVPKIECSVFIKIEYAQLYMMVNSHGNYKSCWLFIIQEFLLTKLNSQNV